MSQFVRDNPFISLVVVFLVFDAFSRVCDVLKARQERLAKRDRLDAAARGIVGLRGGEYEKSSGTDRR